MIITESKMLASSVLRRLSDASNNVETVLVLAHRSTIYDIALGKNVESLEKKLKLIKSFNPPKRRRLHYKYDYDYAMKALITLCYKKALGLAVDKNEVKMFLECMIDETTVRAASSRPAPKNVTPFNVEPAYNNQAANSEEFEHEILFG